MGTHIQCPVCGTIGLNVCEYESMMVLSSQLALFVLRCGECGTQVTSVSVIPPALYPEIERIAREIGAGMGREAPRV